jgi:hypothetical protein
MATRLSTGLVNKLMDTGSFKTTFAGCFIDIYSGAQPAAADDAASGTKLVTLYSDGTTTGLTMEASATDGILEKNASETWSGTAVATGTAGWFRMRQAGDTGTASSTTMARVDGSISTSGAQMNLGSLTITSGAPFVLSAAAFTLPKA